MDVRDFEDLIVWRKSIDLAVDVYAATKDFPAGERFALTMQMRRAAVSVSSNIAEGNGRWTTKDYVHFLITGRGSLYELRSLLHVSHRLGYLSVEANAELKDDCAEIGRMLSGLRASLLRRIRQSL